MEVFARAHHQDYVIRTKQRLRECFPDYYYGHNPEQVEEFIAESISSASHFGLTGESTVGRFIDYRLWWGRAFECTPNREWMFAVLQEQGWSDVRKIREIDMKIFGYSLEKDSGAA